MTQDEIIEMWHKAWPDKGSFVRASAYDLEALAKLVAAKERSDCVFTASIALLGSEKQLADRVINALLTRVET